MRPGGGGGGEGGGVVNVGKGGKGVFYFSE